MKSAITTSIKGLYNYWLRESAKLDYDSLGLAFDGQTVEIAFGAGGHFNDVLAVTVSSRDDTLPENHIYLTISLFNYGQLNPTNPNGSINLEGDGSNPQDMYLDRVIAHEMVHAIMLSTGTLKKNMPQFFTEGIADLVQGDDDDNSENIYKMKRFVEDTDRLETALSFAEGTGNSDSYPAGYMFLRYLAQQSLGISQFVGDSSQTENFRYDTKGAVITNYGEEDTIYFDKDVDTYSISTNLNDFQIESPTGETKYDLSMLILRDVRGKLMTFETPNGTAYAYMAPDSNEVNGNNFGDGNKFEVIFGANYENDTIRAGNGGSYLWGGLQGNDEFFGGNGVDTFVYTYQSGNDTVYNAESQDLVILNDMTLDQISSAQINDSGVNLQFTDGGSLTVNGTPSTFVVRDSDTATYRADFQTKTWRQE